MKKIWIFSLFVANYAWLCAQNDSTQLRFGVDYTSELQSNFGRKYNWVNLLTLWGEVPTEKLCKGWRGGAFQAGTFGSYKLFDEQIVPDLQTYSNIEEDNRWLNFSLLGYEQRWHKVTLYAGVRSANYDYFISPYTSLFTGSSAGIFPTLSVNYDMANYPLSGLGLHAEYAFAEDWIFKTSLYNGIAHDPQASGRTDLSQLFVVRPRRDGLFSMSQLSFRNYAIGAAVQTAGEEHTTTASFWAAVEQALVKNDQREIGLLLHGGFAPSHKLECRYYAAVGAYWAGILAPEKGDQIGVYFNATEVSGEKEQSLELTWHYPLCEWLCVQPAVHYIVTGGRQSVVGLLRVYVSVGD
ncbi:MAG: carbohydrate porin [Bacteroidales bacterium]|jgi:porin|nr:carbohydrate porin [Bacteroidales bacterium]